jgi:hypothetical protein
VAHPARIIIGLLVGSFVFSMVALFLFVGHPHVRARSTRAVFTCLPTYSIVVEHASNEPDGFPGLPGEKIGLRCVDKAYREFHASLIMTGIAIVFAFTAGGLGLRRALTPRTR